MDQSDYSYILPPELISHSPAEPRDSARLLIYNTKTDEITTDIFEHIDRYIPADSVIVLNDTSVIPARLELKKLTDGKVKILFLWNEWRGGNNIKGLPDRKINIGDILLLVDGTKCVEVVGQKNEEFTFKLLVSEQEFRTISMKNGLTPLPPYIHSNMDEDEVRERYQTIFASANSDSYHSVAAPTASLHFTKKVFASLDKKNISRVPITLHVGRGTFSPLTSEVMKSGVLYAEPIFIPQESSRVIHLAKKEGRMIISAGTTATRAVESFAEYIFRNEESTGETRLMISPPYDFKIIDGLITNFHLPETSLLMLVDAFIQYKQNLNAGGASSEIHGGKKTTMKSWKDIYEYAIAHKFRFYSFGDAMLII